MAERVCPAWIGYFLLNPLRKFFENPYKIFNGLVKEGMTVLEPGCGMGYFTLPLAGMVGPGGKVVAEEMLQIETFHHIDMAGSLIKRNAYS